MNSRAHLIETLQRLVIHLEHTRSDTRRDWQDFFKLNEAYERAISEIFPEEFHYFRAHSRGPGLEEGLRRLRRIEEKMDRLSEKENRPCRFEDTDTERFPRFLTGLDPTTVKSRGMERFVDHFSKWFSTKPRAVIVDPHLFSLGNESEETYIEGLVQIIGAAVQRIDIYIGDIEVSGYKPDLAHQIVGRINASKVRDFNFYVCKNIHDRVWLRHDKTADTPEANRWEARVVGASVNGVRERPTYVVDMEPDDAANYAKYLTNLRTDTSTRSSKTPP